MLHLSKSLRQYLCFRTGGHWQRSILSLCRNPYAETTASPHGPDIICCRYSADYNSFTILYYFKFLLPVHLEYSLKDCKAVFMKHCGDKSVLTIFLKLWWMFSSAHCQDVQQTGSPSKEDPRNHTKISPELTADTLLPAPSVCYKNSGTNKCFPTTSTSRSIGLDWEANREFILDFSPAHYIKMPHAYSWSKHLTLTAQPKQLHI